MAALVLVASDLPSLRRSIAAAIEGPDVEVLEAASGPEALRVVGDEEVELVVCDLQVGSMGAYAVCAELHNRETAGVLPHIPFLMLLDRRPDVFLARRAASEGFLLKPLEPVKLRRAVRTLLDGGTYEDDAWRPVTVRAGLADA